MSATYLWQLRTGLRANPSRKHIEGLAAFFRVPVNYFFDEDGTGAHNEPELAAALRKVPVRQIAMRAADLSDVSLDAPARAWSNTSAAWRGCPPSQRPHRHETVTATNRATQRVVRSAARRLVRGALELHKTRVLCGHASRFSEQVFYYRPVSAARLAEEVRTTTATCTRHAVAAMATGSAIGREDLLSDARFASNADRAVHASELNAIIEAWTCQRSKREVMETLGKGGVPTGAVFDTRELLDDPFLRERGTFVTVQHPGRGEFTMPGWPVKMSDSHVPLESARLLGRDNDDVYSELLGRTPAQMSELRAEHVI